MNDNLISPSQVTTTLHSKREVASRDWSTSSDVAVNNERNDGRTKLIKDSVFVSKQPMKSRTYLHAMNTNDPDSGNYIEKNFYDEESQMHPDIRAMSPEEVQKFRQQNEIRVYGELICRPMVRFEHLAGVLDPSVISYFT